MKIDRNNESSKSEPCFKMDQLLDFVDGQLNELESTQLEKHLQTCEDCRETLENIQLFQTAPSKEPDRNFLIHQKSIHQKLSQSTRRAYQQRWAHKGRKRVESLLKDFFKPSMRLSLPIVAGLLFGVVSIWMVMSPGNQSLSKQLAPGSTKLVALKQEAPQNKLILKKEGVPNQPNRYGLAFDIICWKNLLFKPSQGNSEVFDHGYRAYPRLLVFS